MIDPEGKLIDYRLYRDKCICKNGHFVKDLRIFKNRDIKNMVIVDNSIVAFSQQIDNGIHIPTFFGSKNDNSLSILLPFLKTLAGSEDMQNVLRTRLKISSLYMSYSGFSNAKADNNYNNNDKQ